MWSGTGDSLALIGQGRRLRKTDGKYNRETRLMQISYHKEDSHQFSFTVCVYVSGCCVCVCDMCAMCWCVFVICVLCVLCVGVCL